MKAVFTVRLKEGYLILERDTISITADEIATATVVDDDSYSVRDKVGRIAADILKPKEKPLPLAGVAVEEAPGD